MHAFMPARQYRSGHLPRRIMAALLCALLLLTSLSFLAEPAVLASDTRVFSRTLTMPTATAFSCRYAAAPIPEFRRMRCCRLKS